jgi:murein DD-endopeptidase MepM/ murein hydrolase activator NlpD
MFILIKNFFKIAFADRTLMFVTNQGIKCLRLNSVIQIFIILAFAWVVNLFNQSLSFNEIIEAKSLEIRKLEASNRYFKEEFDSINKKLVKINDYILSNDNNEIYKVNFSKELGDNLKQDPNNNLSEEELEVMNKIKDSNQYISHFHNYASNRSEKIERVISSTGLKIISNRNRKNISNENNPMGGPLVSITDSEYLKILAKQRKKYNQIFSSDLTRLISLEKMFQSLPFGKPMKNFRITSGFGYRKDPITKGHAIHQGLDFVGSHKAKILSPSNGRVIHAGKLGDYGNIVIIDHGYGITTRYGHLSEVKVSNNQKVSKGQVIATQGSTGRSTGSHLHYEVRYKNNPLNPKKFINAGDKIINNDDKKYFKS